MDNYCECVAETIQAVQTGGIDFYLAFWSVTATGIFLPFLESPKWGFWGIPLASREEWKHIEKNCTLVFVILWNCALHSTPFLLVDFLNGSNLLLVKHIFMTQTQTSASLDMMRNTLAWDLGQLLPVRRDDGPYERRLIYSLSLHAVQALLDPGWLFLARTWWHTGFSTQIRLPPSISDTAYTRLLRVLICL